MTAIHVVIYLGVGTLGGIIGMKLQLPAGMMIGAMVATILLKLTLNITWELPAQYHFIVQILLGVMLGSTFQTDMLKVFAKMAVPIILSTLLLIMTGALSAIIFAKFGLVDFPTAYISTSPGAMTSLVVLASEAEINAPLVTCFHFFRLLLVIATAPFILKYLAN